MKKITQFIKKYLQDILILIGVSIFSYNILRPATYVCSGLCNRFSVGNYGGYTNYHISLKVFGIFLLTLGILIAIRRYRSNKNIDIKCR